MAKNDFKAFATDRNANVMSQEEWEALPALLSGFTAGKASSAQVNKAIRQASFIAAALAQYTANKSGQDVLDNGDLNGFITKMSAAFGKDFQALDATLTALAGLATGANKLPYFTGTDTASQTDLTSVGRDIIGKSTIADVLTYLGIYDASTSQKGLVRLNGGVTNDDNTLAATSGAVKIAYDAAIAAAKTANGKWTPVDATTSVKGIVQLNSAINSTSTTQAATPSAVKQAYDAATAPALGKGQTLQDLKTSRGTGVTYTNSTGFPIAVFVRITGSTSANLIAYVNGIAFGGGGSTASQTSVATAFFIVPPAATYRVDASGVSTVLQDWSELR